ncbi:trehalase-like domain-containing protein [Nitrospira sp. Nam74]
MTLPICNIEDYALIGDSRTAALVSKTGSMDWLCLPQFDSPSVLNRLLDHKHGGYFSITPLRPFSTRRSYQGSTAVLMTEFQTEDGIVRVTDCMPVLSEPKKARCLLPLRSVLRYIEGIEGHVELEDPRWQNEVLEFAFVLRDGVRVTCNAMANGGYLTGTFAGSSMAGGWQAKRVRLCGSWKSTGSFPRMLALCRMEGDFTGGKENFWAAFPINSGSRMTSRSGMG